jgi:polyhydroxyalkanoate synthase subunit PhaC
MVADRELAAPGDPLVESSVPDEEAAPRPRSRRGTRNGPRRGPLRAPGRGARGPRPAAEAPTSGEPIPGLPGDRLAESFKSLWHANPLRDVLPIDWAAAIGALSTVSARALANPLDAGTAAANLGLKIWLASAQSCAAAAARWWGWPDLAERCATEPTTDKRFAAPEWQRHPVYNLLKQAYLLAAEELLRQAASCEEPGSAEQRRLVFHLRQLIDALSPTNFLATNPAALRTMMETGGASLAEGLRNLLADLRDGRLTMTDFTAFAPGRNLAITPGKVVYRNRLIELIQYTPRAAHNRAVPLLFVPPWINKFYILDLQPQNSLVRYLLEQGFCVFMISWKNPDAAMENIGFADYMTDGPLAASDVAREITASPSVHPIGYCIGGTLLAMTLAYLAALNDDRFGSATFIVSLQDFSEVGDTAVFIDEPQVEFMERQMLERGYLEGREMANMFNLLRSNDLIWSTVVNRYLLGNQPPAFDLLYWNSDTTRMARAAHSFYLRNTYLENNLVKPGKISLLGQKIDLRRIVQEVYAVGAEKDHIVPWRAAWRLTRLIGGRARFALASSGHIAGIVNPPGKGKGAYWVSDAPASPATAETWLAGARKHEGSWWEDWAAWLAPRCGEMVPAAAAGSVAHPPLGDAPGIYVLEA